MLRNSLGEGQDSVSVSVTFPSITEPDITKVFINEMRVAVSPILDHGGLRLFLIVLQELFC